MVLTTLFDEPLHGPSHHVDVMLDRLRLGPTREPMITPLDEVLSPDLISLQIQEVVGSLPLRSTVPPPCSADPWGADLY